MTATVSASFVVLPLLLLPGLALGIAPKEAAAGWIELFDGESLFGWTSEGTAKWSTGNGVLSSDATGATLRSNMAFSEFILKCEFRVATNTTGAVFVRWEKQSKTEANGYQIQLDDQAADHPAGSVIDVATATVTSPRVGEWRALQITASGDHLIVDLDGVTVADGKDARFRTGYIRLQSTSSGRIEFRNLRLKPLALDSLFDGADLAGWKQVAGPTPKPSGLAKLNPIKSKPRPAQWAPEKGAIHVAEGPDQLETEKTYSDFLLQLQVRASSKDQKHHPEGAIYLRGDPGKFQSGYKLLIHNDKNSPTGTMGGLQPARKALGQDNAFVIETIAAYGRHFAVWVDGVLVNDYDDRRPDGIARTGPGTVALAHEPDTMFDFKNIGIVSLLKPGGAAESPKPNPAVSGARGGMAPAPGSTAAPPSFGSASSGSPGLAAPPQGPTPEQLAENARREKVSELTTKNLQTTDPKEQVRINQEILKVEPENQVAYAALQSAQAKIEKAKTDKAQQESAAKQKDVEAATAQAARRDALQKAENALVAGNLQEAADQLAIVRKIDPNDPQAQVLSARVAKEIADRQRLRYALGGALLLGLASLGCAVWMGRGKKSAYLEIASGTDRGKRFEFVGDVLHVGAIEQDGGSKNEIVVHDPDQMISRFHCEIHRRGSKFYVFDVKSANGTFVDGHRIKPGKPVRLSARGSVDLAKVCKLRLGYQRQEKQKS
jgi:hypothetical protein